MAPSFQMDHEPSDLPVGTSGFMEIAGELPQISATKNTKVHEA
jgi:hypothetical protein